VDLGQFLKGGSIVIKPTFKDNRGLTLVELIVGVTILAIITVPLLHTFITGANTGIKSRNFGNATNAAQNLSEQIQALDVDMVLGNATLVDSAAKFYNSGTGALTATAPGADSGKYYIRIPGYTYGGSSFDALITLDASAPVNSSPVAVGNQMDALISMTEADASALVSFRAECGGMMENVNELTIELLTRSITLNVSKIIDSVTDTYKITAVFTYTGTIDCTAEDVAGTTYSFTHSEQSSASVSSVSDSTDGSPVFSAFLFFDGYYRESMQTETVLINNPTGSDINFFIVNTDKGTMPVNYGALIWYKYQNFTADNNPVNSLVFTNLAADKVTNLPSNRVTYRASKNDLLKKTLTVTGYLVETKQLNRKYDVDVTLYKGGSGFTGSVVMDTNSTRLNY